MSIQTDEFDDGQWDNAIAARLGRLRTMPVDTSRLERRLQAAIQLKRPSPAAVRWLRPFRGAIAAGILLAVILGGLMLTTSGGPVLASTADMAQFHNDMVLGRTPVMHVDSVSAANTAIAAQWSHSPQVPNVPDDHVMACCMRTVKNRKVACVLLRGDGEPITMTVANASDMKLPDSPIQVHDGVEYHVQSNGPLNMVMTQRQGRWVCLIGKVPLARLIQLASSLQF